MSLHEVAESSLGVTGQIPIRTRPRRPRPPGIGSSRRAAIAAWPGTPNIVRQVAVDLADVASPSSVIKEARNHLPHGAADQTIHHTWSRILDRLDELCRINTLNTYATATGTM